MTRAGLLLVCVGIATCAGAREVVTIETRPGVKQSFFIAAMGDVKPEAVALIYSGGTGEIRLRVEDGEPKFNPGNFLIRARSQFIRNRVLPVLVDVPSDLPTGVSDAYRRSDAQAVDFRAVVAEVSRRYPDLPVFGVTTSRSTLSGAYLARVLKEREAAGLVLTSMMAVPGRGWEAVDMPKPGEIKLPVLFVHHREDACQATAYPAAERIAEGFTLISVKGGAPARSGPCDPFSPHGFLGREGVTVDAITGWMLNKPYAREIE